MSQIQGVSGSPLVKTLHYYLRDAREFTAAAAHTLSDATRVVHARVAVVAAAIGRQRLRLHKRLSTRYKSHRAWFAARHNQSLSRRSLLLEDRGVSRCYSIVADIRGNDRDTISSSLAIRLSCCYEKNRLKLPSNQTLLCHPICWILQFVEHISSKCFSGLHWRANAMRLFMKGNAFQVEASAI